MVSIILMSLFKIEDEADFLNSVIIVVIVFDLVVVIVCVLGCHRSPGRSRFSWCKGRKGKQ